MCQKHGLLQEVQDKIRLQKKFSQSEVVLLSNFRNIGEKDKGCSLNMVGEHPPSFTKSDSERDKSIKV